MQKKQKVPKVIIITTDIQENNARKVCIQTENYEIKKSWVHGATDDSNHYHAADIVMGHLSYTMWAIVKRSKVNDKKFIHTYTARGRKAGTLEEEPPEPPKPPSKA